MTDLIGKIVEVGTADMIYIGKLIEMNEQEIYLESESAGWIIVPTEKVAFVREPE